MHVSTESFLGHSMEYSSHAEVQRHLLTILYPEAQIITSLAADPITVENLIYINRRILRPRINKMIDPLLFLVAKWGPVLRAKVYAALGIDVRAAPSIDHARRSTYVPRKPPRTLTADVEKSVIKLLSANTGVSTVDFAALPWADGCRRTRCTLSCSRRGCIITTIRSCPKSCTSTISGWKVIGYIVRSAGMAPRTATMPKPTSRWSGSVRMRFNWRYLSTHRKSRRDDERHKAFFSQKRRSFVADAVTADFISIATANSRRRAAMSRASESCAANHCTESRRLARSGSDRNKVNPRLQTVVIPLAEALWNKTFNTHDAPNREQNKPLHAFAFPSMSMRRGIAWNNPVVCAPS